MAKKTFKIGEWAKGGIIIAEVNQAKGLIRIECLDYFSKELYFSLEVDEKGSRAFRELDDELHDWTSHYWAEKVMDWIESKSHIERFPTFLAGGL